MTQNNDTLCGKSYNIRVTFDSDGTPIIGWVHGIKTVNGESESITEIKRTTEAEHLAIAKALGIRSSSIHCSVNRALRRRTDVQMDLMQAVTC